MGQSNSDTPWPDSRSMNGRDGDPRGKPRGSDYLMPGCRDERACPLSWRDSISPGELFSRGSEIGQERAYGLIVGSGRSLAQSTLRSLALRQEQTFAWLNRQSPVVAQRQRSRTGWRVRDVGWPWSARLALNLRTERTLRGARARARFRCLTSELSAAAAPANRCLACRRHRSIAA
jgi:hypothetical protein